MIPPPITDEKPGPPAERETVRRYFAAKGQSLATAESCTGGLLSFWLTDPPGASRYFKGGLIAYSSQVKTELLGLNYEKIQKEGYATKACATAMAHGAKKLLHADWALAVTGVAGPKPGENGEPVGQIAFAVATPQFCQSLVKSFPQKRRGDLRRVAALFSLQFLISVFEIKNHNV